MKKQPFSDFDLQYTPGHLLRRCHQRSHEIFNEVMDEFGLTRQQTALLITLLKKPGASVQELADVTGTDRNTLGGVTSRLVVKGLVDRRRSNQDARAYELQVSRAGVALMRKMEKRLALVQKKILEPLDEAERKEFIRLTRKLAGFP